MCKLVCKIQDFCKAVIMYRRVSYYNFIIHVEINFVYENFLIFTIDMSVENPNHLLVFSYFFYLKNARIMFQLKVFIY